MDHANEELRKRCNRRSRWQTALTMYSSRKTSQASLLRPLLSDESTEAVNTTVRGHPTELLSVVLPLATVVKMKLR